MPSKGIEILNKNVKDKCPVDKEPGFDSHVVLGWAWPVRAYESFFKEVNFFVNYKTLYIIHI